MVTERGQAMAEALVVIAGAALAAGLALAAAGAGVAERTEALTWMFRMPFP